ncbi:peroxiredoxin-like family protein [Granulicella arctica]|uniref:peroxiredoxin-like family protein n=1 Tax=Granulicella arctica TaxID=940613 RepID=UPI0021E042FF|nr:peroxiredoxin-like family protein [Granulicella arctica]
MPETFTSATLLQDRLDTITANTRRLVQAERLAISEQATADLFATGIEDRLLPVGSTAPSFSLPDALTGKPVSSADLLALGPLVINFFRGRWDPYCVTELEAWRDLFPDLRRTGALLVAISPQTNRQNDFTVQQHGLRYPLLADAGAVLAGQYGIGYSLPETSRRYYRSILINIPFNNSGAGYERATEESWRLPLPATIVVAQDNTIAFAEAYADPRVRPEPSEVFKVLASLPLKDSHI